MKQISLINEKILSKPSYSTAREYLRNLIKSYILNYYNNRPLDNIEEIDIIYFMEQVYNKLKSINYNISSIFKTVKKFLDYIFDNIESEEIKKDLENLFYNEDRKVLQKETIKQIYKSLNPKIKRTFISGDILNEITKSNISNLDDYINNIIAFYNISDTKIKQDIKTKLTTPQQTEKIKISYKYENEILSKIKLRSLYNILIPDQILTKVDIFTIEHLELSNDPELKNEPIYIFISLKEYIQTIPEIKTLDQIKENYLNVISNIIQSIKINIKSNILSKNSINNFKTNIENILNVSFNEIENKNTTKLIINSNNNTANYSKDLNLINNNNNIKINIDFNLIEDVNPSINILYIMFESNNKNIKNGFAFRQFEKYRYDWESYYFKKTIKSKETRIILAKFTSLLKNLTKLEPDYNFNKENYIYHCIYNSIKPLLSNTFIISNDQHSMKIPFLPTLEKYFNNIEIFKIWLILSNNIINLNNIKKDNYKEDTTKLNNNIKNTNNNNNSNNSTLEENFIKNFILILNNIINDNQYIGKNNNITVFNMLNKLFTIFKIHTKDCYIYTIENEFNKNDHSIIKIIKLIIEDIYLINYDYKNIIKWLFVI